ncbi:type III-B CRISPR module RAMP protein Cmr4 [Halomonas qaidamensis]|uniref:Type III-B CRISPR module RAMP protein Cmr4 n=1 Tax=Halomonas qaidamensis TaxID=2866211 RepID=A0ABY6JS73_9GAMM|nr:type III-B CRISPR module RAMP protein Cmr4 [Halomonas qaidamensis]UYV19462.1 type III-B CRISPR module RAMP protein Cmr4 [Halomonas qaidamensis]
MTATTHLIFGLFTETPLHAGGGSKDGLIDLPIQREIHSGWPCVFGSAMKGALRARADQLGVDDDLKVTAFGPDTLNASDHAGALLVGDARLLLLPVRSLTGHFRMVTCPALLRRFVADRARAGLTGPIPAIPEVEQGSVQVKNPQGKGDIFLEEFCFTPQPWSTADEWVELLLALVAPVPGLEEKDVRETLASQLTVVDDDSFSHFCRSAIPVLPHVRINSQTKTVEGGGLWHEESLPPDTLLYCVVAAQPPRSKRYHDMNSAKLLEQACEALFASGPYLQVGGNETTGMGWCRVARVAAELPGGEQ